MDTPSRAKTTDADQAKVPVKVMFNKRELAALDRARGSLARASWIRETLRRLLEHGAEP